MNWEAVAGSWAKRTVSSRLLLFAARRYLEEAGDTVAQDADRRELIDSTPLPDEVKRAFAAPPALPPGGPVTERWGEFVDAALATELETVSYGERPPLLHELKTGLGQAAAEAGAEGGSGSALGRWFIVRRDALPGADLPEDPDYLPV